MSPAEAERLDRLRLSLVVEPGDARVPRLLADHPPGRVVESAGRDVSLDGGAVPSGWVTRAASLDRTCETVLGRARASGLRWVVPGDSEWPERLADLDTAEPIHGVSGAPLGLWVRGAGRLSELADTSVAVVGARDATTYGSDVTGDLAADIADAGHTVVSGAAYGIDSAAHRGALAAGGPTVAVLACGADLSYPRAHATLLEHIASTGAVVSEQAPASAPTKGRFLTRNRLIAAMTCGTVVVEAARRSGALNTVNWAAQLGRVLMGVPGPVTSQTSTGVHLAIRAGQAMLVTDGHQVLEAVSPVGVHDATPPSEPPNVLDLMPEGMRIVLEGVPAGEPESVATIGRRIGADPAMVEVVLGRLVEDGWVAGIDTGFVLRRRADLSRAPAGSTVRR